MFKIKLLTILAPIAFSFVSCIDKAKNENMQQQFVSLEADLGALPNSFIDTIYKFGDTMKLKIIDSISWTQDIEESMINTYILHKMLRSSPNSKRIVVEKIYPTRPHLPKWKMDLAASDVEPIVTTFDDSAFNALAEYLIKLPNSRTTTSVLLAVNTRWAIVKNGNLEKSWGENFFELLYPFCKECEEGKTNYFFLDMEKVRNTLNEKTPANEKREIDQVFDQIFLECRRLRNLHNKKDSAHSTADRS